MAEGKRVRQYPREVPRERPVSAHRGTGGESLSIRGCNQPSIYTYMYGTSHVSHYQLYHMSSVSHLI